MEPPVCWAAWLKAEKRAPEEKVLSDGVAVAFSEENTNPCSEPIWPRALDNPKLPFWGFISSWCLECGAERQSHPNTSRQKCQVRADSMAPCTFALNVGLGRRPAAGWLRDTGNGTQCLSKDCVRTHSWWPWAGSWVDVASTGVQPTTHTGQVLDQMR